MNSESNKNIVVAITGASGSIYAKSLIQRLLYLKSCGETISISVVISKNGLDVLKYETGDDFLENSELKIYDNNDFYAPFASGSAAPFAMVIVPCSMGTLGRIANGTSDNLISRAADVVLKERKKLILLIRETPLNLIHLENMRKITLAGGIVMPASPSFYMKPRNIEQLVDGISSRIIDLLGFNQNIPRWGGV
ncbi:MAG: UbiX family flavin prenyltransferase [Bacteroidales bacterium]|jgi:4-hydroxy-3-polyprenylbenzoate decarboxylase